MKIRSGFVSNSSSMSFILGLDQFTDVFQLATKMLRIALEEDDEERYKLAKKHLKKARAGGIDPNIGVSLPTANCNTYILRKDDGYYIDTNQDYDGWDGLEPWRSKGGGDDHFGLEKGNAFYFAELDVIGKLVDKKEPDYCHQPGHSSYEEVIRLKDGPVLCTKCDQEMFKSHAISGKDSGLAGEEDEGDEMNAEVDEGTDDEEDD